MVKYIANIVTSCRIFGSVLLLFSPAFSIEFYIIYVICGFSDMIDGTIARKTKSYGEFGAKIDTVADLVFVTVSLIKLLPQILVPLWLWLWVVVIAIIKIGNIIKVYIFKKQFISVHTTMNKIAGFSLFLLPLTLPFAELKFSAIPVCFISNIAAIQEWFCVSEKDCDG